MDDCGGGSGLGESAGLRGELDRAALARVHDPARTMWIPLVLLTASGVILALLSNEVIGFLWNAVPRNW